jgi:SWI/SNF-related matrix-associated actin-dependent regulator of chromatin subfamily A3
MVILPQLIMARSCGGDIGKLERYLACAHILISRSPRVRGCVTPQILGNISKYGIERCAGFSDLRTEDRERVREALTKRHVDLTADTGSAAASSSKPVPVPQPSAVTAIQQSSAPSTKKRKAEDVPVPGPSQTQNAVAPSPTQAAYRQAAIGGMAWEEGADAREVVDQQVDELYGTLSSNVVGVQYYKGECVSLSCPLYTSYLS